MPPHARGRSRWWMQRADGREHARGRSRWWMQPADGREQAANWELYLLVLSAILSPFVTRIQRWWRIVRAGGTTARPRPGCAAMVVMRWVCWDDEPLYSRWFQVDFNEWGYSFQHWGQTMVVLRTSLP